MLTLNLAMASLLVCQVGPVNIPHAENETSLVRVKSDPAAVVEKRILLSGNGEISDIYQGLYGDAQKTHVSIKFNELGNDSNQVGETALLYVDRKRGKAVVDELIARQEKHVGEKIPLRALVTLKAAAFKDAKEWDKLEVLDVQFAVEGSDPIRWQPWMLTPSK